MQTQSDFKPVGDSLLAMSAPVRVMPSLDRYPASFLHPASLHKMRNGMNLELLPWMCDDPEKGAIFLGDPTLYEGATIPGCLALLRLRDEYQRQLEEKLRQAAGEFGVDQLHVEDVMGLLFDSGIISVLVFVRQKDGWTAATNALAPPNRDTLANVTQPILRDLITPVAAYIVRQLASHSATWKHHVANKPLADVPYIDFIHGGAVERVEPGFSLGGKLRDFVQPDTAKPLHSQSPKLGEFIWLGSICSVVFVQDPELLPSRFREIGALIAVYSGLFDQLTAICGEVSRIAEDEDRRSIEELRQYEERIQMYFREMSGPSFTYKKDLRILRSNIYHQWEVAPLFERAQFLLATLNRRAAYRAERRAANATRVTNAILLIIAIATLLSVYNDASQIFERLWQ